MLQAQHRYSMQIMSRIGSLGNPLEILACKQRSPNHKIISHSSTLPLIFRLPRTPFKEKLRIYFLAFFGLAIGSSRILRISSSMSFLSVLDWYFSTSRAGAVASLVIPFLVMAEFQVSEKHRFICLQFNLPMVVKRRATAALSLSPTTSYWRKTFPRTHSTTPTFPVRSSSS